MGSNIGPWTKEVLGFELSPQQFLQSQEAQDAVFNGKFGQYVQKFGPEGAAQAWFAGPGGVGKLDRKDQLGTSVGAYGKKFMTALGSDAGPPLNILPQVAQPQTVQPQSVQQGMQQGPVGQQFQMPQMVALQAPMPPPKPIDLAAFRRIPIPGSYRGFSFRG